VPDALLEAARTTLDGSLRELRKQLEGLDANALNDRPRGDGTNPLAVLAVHALASTHSWLALATGSALPPRDRPREFETRVDDPVAFLASVDATSDACREILAGAEGIDPGKTGTAPWRTGTHWSRARSVESSNGAIPDVISARCQVRATSGRSTSSTTRPTRSSG